jgi:hypothetical protein
MRMYCPATDPPHEFKVPFHPSHDDLICDEHQIALKTAFQLKPRKPLQRTSKKKGGRRGSTLRRGRGFSASPAQQRKVKGLPCIVCGRDDAEAYIEPAHVYPRRLQSCSCAEGVVPLCHEHHRLYDDQDEHFDLLPFLVSRSYNAELVHAVAAHGVPVSELLRVVTGCQWKPVSELEEAA